MNPASLLASRLQSAGEAGGLLSPQSFSHCFLFSRHKLHPSEAYAASLSHVLSSSIQNLSLKLVVSSPSPAFTPPYSVSFALQRVNTLASIWLRGLPNLTSSALSPAFAFDQGRWLNLDLTNDSTVFSNSWSGFLDVLFLLFCDKVLCRPSWP